MAKRRIFTSVITGDVVNSRKGKSPAVWLVPLKKVLSSEGESPKTWEIFRGDSFQVEVRDPSKSFLMALKLKAALKSIKHLDVRLGIGIGEKGYSASRVTESNGDAFINSGETLEKLKYEKRSLAVKTPWEDFDKEMNLYIRLGLIAMDFWTTGAAEVIRVMLDNDSITQSKLAAKLKVSQSTISEKKKRAFYAEIAELELYYRERVTRLIG